MTKQRAWLSYIGVVALAGCDPCAGVIDCIVSPRLHIDGRILDPITVVPAAGATIRVIAHNGSARDSVTVTSAADGTFEANVNLAMTGTVTYDLVVSPR